MPFKRFVETGRVAYISGGRYGGKLCSIVDVIDQTRALVDGPRTGVPRIPIRLNQLRLTKYVFKFPYKAPTRIVKKVWDRNKILDKWKESKWAKNLAARRLRRRLTDFDRFKLRFARRVRNTIRTIEFNKLLKDDNRKRDTLRKENKGKKGYNRRDRTPKGTSGVKAPPKALKTLRPKTRKGPRAAKGPKDPKAAKGPKDPKKAKGPKDPKGAKGPKGPKAGKGSKDPKAAKGPKGAKAPKDPKAAKAPKDPKPPKAPQATEEKK